MSRVLIERQAKSCGTDLGICLESSLTMIVFSRPSTSGAIGSSFLPAAPSIFYGRQETVDEIVEAITTQEPARVVVLGTGGVGKVKLVPYPTTSRV